MQNTKDQKNFWLILIAGLGYFSDSYDVFLYNVMRVPSLTELGLSGDALTKTGIWILNAQVFGALLGGFFWGLLGDRIGRKKALIGSIIVDSVAMILNAFVHNIELYAALRFIVGFGIAGEVGLGATLIAESLPKQKRTIGLALFTAFGLAGVVAAALSIEIFHWRMALLIGGIGGLLLLFLRASLYESAMFLKQAPQKFFAPLKEMVSSTRSIGRYAGCVAILAPNFFVTGFLLTLSPEIAKFLALPEPVKANIVLLSYFIIAVSGDFFGAWLTRILKNRRKALAIFIAGNAMIASYYLWGVDVASMRGFYIVCGSFGLFNLWALASTVAVEQFPTAIRATVSTSAVNMARFSLVGMNLLFLLLKPMGTLEAAAIVGSVVIGLAFIAVMLMRETYDADLNRV